MMIFIDFDTIKTAELIVQQKNNTATRIDLPYGYLDDFVNNLKGERLLISPNVEVVHSISDGTSIVALRLFKN
jgi:hypothetical protein